jgi:predicted RNase H-like HicB family nuclease
MKKMTAKDYLKLPYHINIQHIIDKSGDYYFATVLELKGCLSDGATEAEARKNIRESMELWIEVCIDEGREVPKPIKPDNYSGRFVMRMPKTLHAQLATEAAREGVSLNQYALYKLSR